MIRMGLTGGIAAGKSVASRCLTAHGIPVIDYDQLSRQVVAPGSRGLAAVVSTFGQTVLAPDGSLDRRLLGTKVFADEQSRERLEEIIHPLVISQAAILDAEIEANGATMIVHDIPLLVEVAGPEAFDVVAVVDAPAEVRMRRLVEQRAMTVEQAWDRIDSQIADQDRLAAADVVWDGSGTIEQLCDQIEAWLAQVEQTGVHYRPDQERTNFLVTEDWSD
ncbi:MAG: dephospho-CoA kinase [Propionibacteriaceae bacterium]|jgi:dephospho-CoA kinase|nr:dephospho-CoA kinase [Propionibacteriaceae bacterium]